LKKYLMYFKANEKFGKRKKKKKGGGYGPVTSRLGKAGRRGKMRAEAKLLLMRFTVLIP